MFWTEWGQNPRIERSDMDGNHRSAIVTDNLFWPNGLTIDYPTEIIYFADAKLDFINRCNYQGGDRTYVLASALVRLISYFIQDICSLYIYQPFLFSSFVNHTQSLFSKTIFTGPTEKPDLWIDATNGMGHKVKAQ